MSKQDIFNRDGGRCFYCDTQLTLDLATEEHLLSKVHGGNNSDYNLTIACKEHNHEAGHKSIVEKVKLRESRLFANRAPDKEVMVRLLRVILQTDCSNELADKITGIVIDMLGDSK